MTTIYSLSNIEESTDALSKGLLGFTMKLNQNVNDTSWQKVKGMYTFPDADETKKDYRTPWININRDTSSSMTTKSTDNLPDPLSIDNLNDTDCIRFDCCNGDCTGVDSTRWCDDTENADYWNKGYCQYRPPWWSQCSAGTCCDRFWNSSGDCGEDDKTCMRCQYIDAVADGEGGCLSCNGKLSACGDDPTKSPFKTGCYPYAVGYAINTFQNGFTGGCNGVCAAATQTHQYWTKIPWINWLFGTNFLGTRTISGTDNLPVCGSDYLLAQCNRNYFKTGVCVGGYCDKGDNYDTNVVKGKFAQTWITMAKEGGWVPVTVTSSDINKLQPGWLQGVWTFPITSQNFKTKKSPWQDTLQYFASGGKDFALHNNLSLSDQNIMNSDNPVAVLGVKSDQKDQQPLMTLTPTLKAGLGAWLNDMLGSIEDYKAGFLRDYVIIRSFATVYATCMYGIDDKTDAPLATIRADWFGNSFQVPWRCDVLLQDNEAPFGNEMLNTFSNLGSSYKLTQGKILSLPFSNYLINIVNQSGFTVNNSGVYLTLPVDGFRMNGLITDNKFILSDFVTKILTPLSGDQSIPVTNISSPELSYSGITYKNLYIFQTTRQTTPDSYDIQTYKTFDPKDYDKQILWPENTHSWIQDDGTVRVGMIEAFYFVKVQIKKWTPGLALLFLTAIDMNKTNITIQSPLLPPVLENIKNDSGYCPILYLNTICNISLPNTDKCTEIVSKSCTQELPSTVLNTFGQDANKYLLNKASNNVACKCFNSGLNPPGGKGGIRSSMCFDQNCSLPVTPGGALTMNDIFNLTPEYCSSQCSVFNQYKQQAQNPGQDLNPARYSKLCAKSAVSTFNTSFLIKLLVPSILIPVIILLAMGINKVSVIISVLALLALTGISVYLARLFTPKVGCFDGIKKGGLLPVCVSAYNNDMKLPLSFCDINMFCECPGWSATMFCGSCECGGDVCIPTDGTKRETEVVQIKMVNIPMVVLFGSLLLLIPILIVLLRRRFFPKLPLFILVSIVILTISMYGLGLYMSIAKYGKSRVVYKDFDKYCGKCILPKSFARDVVPDTCKTSLETGKSCTVKCAPGFTGSGDNKYSCDEGILTAASLQCVKNN